MLLQMHSSSPATVEKYQRSRLEIPVKMVRDLVEDLRLGAKKQTSGKASSSHAAASSTSLPVDTLPDPGADAEETFNFKEATAAEGCEEGEEEVPVVDEPLSLPEEPPVVSTLAIRDHPQLPQPSSGSKSRKRVRAPSISSTSEDASDAETDRQLLFYVKVGVNKKALPTFKYHVTALGDVDKLACARMPLSADQLMPMGNKPPPEARVCKVCMAARPEIARRVRKWGLSLH
jgi:hypothetical protein